MARANLVVSFALLAAPLLIGSIDRTSNLDARLLAAHNRERAAAAIQPLAWDAKLAADAAGWATHLAETGQFEHSEADPYDPDTPGENLWAGTRSAYSPEEMVGLWIAEKKAFRPGIFPANSKTGNLEDVGHYTQLMWRKTGKVGCAVAAGAKEDVLVCRYSEGGNMVGERPF